MSNYTECKVQQHRIWRFLFVRGLPHVTDRWIGRRGQTEWGLLSPKFIARISLCGAGPKMKSVDQITPQLAAFLSVNAERCSILSKNCFTSIYGSRAQSTVTVLDFIVDCKGIVTLRVSELINPLQPSGHYMYHQFNVQQFYVLPTHCICVFCVDLRTNSHYFPIKH